MAVVLQEKKIDSPALNCPTVKLSNEVEMPMLGIGTIQVAAVSQEAIVYALRECGIRHIDTSKFHGCEELLAKAIRESGIPRSDLWLTDKLWPGDYGYESSKKSFEESCSKMGVEYFDMFMLHWPSSMQSGCSNREARTQAWRALEEIYAQGKCRAIGVSNFTINHLKQLKEDCNVMPHVNQMEYHPFLQPTELMEYCRQEDITFAGYCPLAKTQILTNPTVLQVAQKYERSPAQISIRWILQNGVPTITSSTKKERVRENCEVFDFLLEEEDMAALGKLHDGRHTSWDPTNVE